MTTTASQRDPRANFISYPMVPRREKENGRPASLTARTLTQEQLPSASAIQRRSEEARGLLFAARRLQDEGIGDDDDAATLRLRELPALDRASDALVYRGVVHRRLLHDRGDHVTGASDRELHDDAAVEIRLLGEFNGFVPIYIHQAFIKRAFAAGVPESSTWMMMIAGFGFVGASMRRRTRVTSVTYG